MMAQWLRALAAVTDDPSFVFWHQHGGSQLSITSVPGDLAALLTSEGSCTLMVHLHILNHTHTDGSLSL